MEYLVANYDIELDVPILVKRPEAPFPRYEIELSGYEASLTLSTQRHSASKSKGDKNWSVPYTHFLITVARKDVPPPPLPERDDGVKDYTVQHDYFWVRRDGFASIAAEVFNRAIKFFKYHLWQPLLSEVDEKNNIFMNPIWTDENGEEVGQGSSYLIIERTPAERLKRFGVIKLEIKHDKSLLSFLKKPEPHSLRDEIAYDAQSAIYLGNYRRAVLELALSVELLVKQVIFGGKSTGGLAFEYLEDKGKINVRVLELIDNIALQVFGCSYRLDHVEKYKDIDHLFRCRNKVAHRGEVVFKDDNGATHIVDEELLEKWWKSLQHLSKWIERNGKNNP